MEVPKTDLNGKEFHAALFQRQSDGKRPLSCQTGSGNRNRPADIEKSGHQVKNRRTETLVF